MTLCRHTLCLPLLAALFLFSCTKKNIPGPQGPAGPQGAAGTNAQLKGGLQGKVFLYDTTGALIADKSGVSVSLDYTTPLIQTTTSSDGSFTLDSVNEGTYSISLKKQGFGTMRFFSIINTGTYPPSRTGTMNLTQQMSSNYDLKSLTIDTSSKPSLAFSVILAHPQNAIKASLLIYVNDSTGVGNGHSKFIYDLPFTQINDSTLTVSPFTLSITQTFFQATKSNYLYFAAALDNPAAAYYKDESGNYIAPSAAKLSTETILYNAQHIY